MAGIKIGDRLLVMGAADVPLAATLAQKTGLTGRACVVDAEQHIAGYAAAIEGEGALIESIGSPWTSLPLEAASFDVVVMRNVLPSIDAARRAGAAAEALRVLRPGGRCIVIDDQKHESTAEAALREAGFRGVRTLAARDKLMFVEGLKAGASASAR
jgi:ubiquinone/menaquinone biosynthesis C-methylase UbiE